MTVPLTLAFARFALRMGEWPVSPPAELRQKADAFRRLANVATAGGHGADRQLRTLADEFDRQADELDRLAKFFLEEANTCS